MICSLFLVFFEAILFDSILVGAGEVSSSQIAALEFLYNSTNGNDWVWKNETEYGIPWNFTVTSSSPNPCMDNWQGVSCTENCSTSSICNIVGLSLSSNNISGTLPSEIVSLAYVESISLTDQRLIGSIPSTIGQLLNLQSLALYNNYFSQEIPTALASLVLLTHFDISQNDLTGEFPTCLFSLSRLIALVLDKNDFTGSVPNDIGTLSALETLDVGYNDFYGTIPTTLSMLTNLTTLYMDHSLYTGRLDAVTFPPKLQYINVGDNEDIIGNFPFSLCDCLSLQHISVDHMLIGGTFPTCLTSLRSLDYLHVSDNLLSSTLPAGLFDISVLRTARLNSMYLAGDLNAVFTNYSTSLTTIDLGDNIFSGTLPRFAFSPVLETFSASKNCFSGGISSDVCTATALLNLALSGLTSGSSCLMSTSVLGYGLTTVSTVPGSLPSCIFEMPNVAQVNIAGNGMRSGLYDIPMTSKLRNLTLSYNRLTGTIPVSIQTRSEMNILDLSFNRLKGTIEQMTNYTFTDGSGLNPETTVNLDSNRLSGSIPAAFSHSTAPLDILEGNIFSCDKNPLPNNDDYHDKYTCGSDDLNIPLYALVSLCSVFIAMFGFAWYKAAKDIAISKVSVYSNAVDVCNLCLDYLWWTPEKRCLIDSHPLLGHISLSFYRFRLIIIMLAVFTTVVALPVFLVLKTVENGEYSAVTHQYGWVMSVAYLHNEVPAVVLNCLWVVTIVFLMAFEFWWYTNRESSLLLLERLLLFLGHYTKFLVIDKASSKHSKIDGTLLNVVRKFLFILLNVSIVLVVNALFVTAILTQSRIIQFVVVGLIVLFKLSWNPVVVFPRMAQLRFGSYMILLMVVFNNIIAPILATMAVDVSCFESLFVPPDPITITYYHVECVDSVFGVCTDTKTKSASTSFTPPWIYSDECSSAMLNYYLPIYVVMYGVVGVFVPVMQLLSLIYFSTPTECEDPNAAIDRSALLRYIKSTIYQVSSTVRTCMPIESEEDLFCGKYSFHGWCKYGNAHAKRRTSSDDITDRASSMYQPSAVVGNENRHAEYCQDFHASSFYNLKRLAVNNVMIFSLLLTFGISYPPLAIILATNVVLNTLVFQVCAYKHHQQAASNPGCLKIWKLVLATESKDVYNVLFGSRTFLYVFSAMFAALFLFDISVGQDTAGAITFLVLIYGCRLGAIYIRRTYPRLCLENNPLFLNAAVAATKAFDRNTHTTVNSDFSDNTETSNPIRSMSCDSTGAIEMHMVGNEVSQP